MKSNFQRLFTLTLAFLTLGALSVSAQLSVSMVNNGGTISVSAMIPAGSGNGIGAQVGTSIVIAVPAGALSNAPSLTGSNASYFSATSGCFGNTQSGALQYVTLSYDLNGNPTPLLFTPGVSVSLFDFALSCAPPPATQIISFSESPAQCASNFTAFDFFNSTFLTTSYGTDISCDPFTPLPIELLAFNASKGDNVTNLTWKTASEIDNKGFNVQRSLDGNKWDIIGWVDGSGTTDQVQAYSFTDFSPFKGANYYRLLQEDYDGNSDYTEIRVVEFDAITLKLNAYPNPSLGKIVLEVNHAQEESISYRISDATGKIVLQRDNQSTPGGKYDLDLSHLPGGVYQVTALHARGQGSMSLVILEK